jgi:serine/threonine protein kinase
MTANLSFAEAVALIERARSLADLMGSGLGVAVGDWADAYRRLVKIVHPDVAPAGRTSAATAAFARLSVLWDERDGRVLTTKHGSYRVGTQIAAGDIANLYRVDGGVAVLKLPRMPIDNDLMAAETAALERLARHGEPRFREYAPRLMESFTHQDDSGVRRKANVLERLRGFVSLADVAGAIPDGLDPRDVAWMWRRLLVALGWAHRAGVVHGAVLPEHVLIHPAEHGLVLVDWCYSVAPGERIPALVAKHRDRYPPEVIGRAPASAATDIFMATGTMRRLIKDLPKPMRRFADGCVFDAPRMRPQDAWRLLAEFDEMLDNLYGPRRFREFALPAVH